MFQLVPSICFADSFEKVVLSEVFDNEYKAIVTRQNGDQYFIEYGIGVLSIWRYEGKVVYINSPGLFAGIGSEIMLPGTDQSAKIWDSEYIVSSYSNNTYQPTMPSLVDPLPTPLISNTFTAVGFIPGFNEYAINDIFYDMDTAPYIKNGRIYIPVRYIAYALGIPPEDVLWNADSGSVSLFKGNTHVNVAVGSNVMVVNLNPIVIDCYPEITDNRLFLPARYIAEAFGASVSWNEENNIVVMIY